MNKIFPLGLFLFSNIALCSAQTKAVRFETKEAGTLASLFKHSGVDFSDVRTLVVAGPLNGDDIVAIREACGVYNEYNNDYILSTRATTGKVSIIDMSDSYVLSGGKSYAKDFHDYYDYSSICYTKDNVSSYMFFYDTPQNMHVWFPMTDDVEFFKSSSYLHSQKFNVVPIIKTINSSNFTARFYSEDIIKYIGSETKPLDISVSISVPEYMVELYRADTDNNMNVMNEMNYDYARTNNKGIILPPESLRIDTTPKI